VGCPIVATEATEAALGAGEQVSEPALRLNVQRELENMKTQNKSESYQIEKGVPIPVVACRKFPLNEMEPEESFSLSAKEVKNAQNAIHRFGKGKFIIRKWENAYRCWRIK